MGTADPAQPPSPDDADAVAEDARWRRLLIDGDEHRNIQRFFRRIPSSPRCKLCQCPFGGFGGRVVSVAGFRPSRKNPNLCVRCCESMKPGGIELDIAVLFADVRESTAICERVGASSYARLLNRFYMTSTDVLVSHDAIIDKLIGDEVMALFIPGFAGPDYRRKSAEAAVDLVTTLNTSGDLGVGAAVCAGSAFVGTVSGSPSVIDFTALGDPVNAAARLQSQAAAGEVIVTDDLYPHVRERFPDATPRTLAIRGQELPALVHVICARDVARGRPTER